MGAFFRPTCPAALSAFCPRLGLCGALSGDQAGFQSLIPLAGRQRPNVSRTRSVVPRARNRLCRPCASCLRACRRPVCSKLWGDLLDPETGQIKIQMSDVVDQRSAQGAAQVHPRNQRLAVVGGHRPCRCIMLLSPSRAFVLRVGACMCAANNLVLHKLCSQFRVTPYAHKSPQAGWLGIPSCAAACMRRACSRRCTGGC